MTQEDITKIFSGEVKLNGNLQTFEYVLAYHYGCWVTKMRIYAENDAEAIYDAEHSGLCPKLTYRLYCGERVVKEWTEHREDNISNTVR